MPFQTKTRSYSNKSTVKWLVLAGFFILVIVGVLYYRANLNSKKISTIPSTTSAGSPASPSSKQPGATNNTSSSNIPASSSSASTSQQTGSASSTVALIKPWGNFVSNHSPGQNGAPTTETSTCNTTAGATCYIRFTNGSQTKLLPSKVADGHGSVIWNWDVKTAGFSAGNWQITAVASLGGQTKTAADSIPLVVQ